MCYICSTIVEVATRELRNDTAGVLRRVEGGEPVVITVRGKPVADLVPHRAEGPGWISHTQLATLLARHSADPGLRGDLGRIAGDTTDDLGPIR
jgi:prevent-host-death family protein